MHLGLKIKKYFIVFIDCHYGAIMLFLLGFHSLVVPLYHFDSASLYHFDSASVVHNGLSFCKKCTTLSM